MVPPAFPFLLFSCIASACRVGERHNAQSKRDLKILTLASKMRCSNLKIHVLGVKPRESTWTKITRVRNRGLSAKSLANAYLFRYLLRSQLKRLHDLQSSVPFLRETLTLFSICRWTTNQNIEQNNWRGDARLKRISRRKQALVRRFWRREIGSGDVVTENCVAWGYLFNHLDDRETTRTRKNGRAQEASGV